VPFKKNFGDIVFQTPCFVLDDADAAALIWERFRLCELCLKDERMNRILWFAALIILPSCTFVTRQEPSGTSHLSAINVYDGFEKSDLSGNWDSRKLVSGALEFQSQFVRSGKKAVKITLCHGDQIDSEKGSNLERSELLEADHLWASEGHSYSYSFSMFIPEDFPLVPTRLVIAQWKQFCPRSECRPDNPVIALRYVNGELTLTNQISSKKTTLYRTIENIRGRWLDFKFQIRFSTEHDGQIKAWLDNKRICDYKGVNCYPENDNSGYPVPSRFYFKMGLYRDQTAEPMTIYIDDYRKKEL
jgi:hypothetical protein